MNQGRQVVSRSRKDKGMISPLHFQKRISPINASNLAQSELGHISYQENYKVIYFLFF